MSDTPSPVEAPSDLKTVIPPTPNERTYNGKKYLIEEIKTKNVEVFMQAVAPVWKAIQDRKHLPKVEVVGYLMSNHMKEVVTMLSVTLQASPAEIGEFRAMETADALLSVLEVNLTFFIQQGLPVLVRRGASLLAAVKPHNDHFAGQTNSNS